jgi:hypothetical protein
MQDRTGIVDIGKVSISDQGVSLSVAPLFAGQGRQCRNVPQGAGSGAGLQSHRSVDDQVEAISAVLDSQLLNIVARGFVLSAAESNVADTLDEIRSTCSMAAVPSDGQPSLPVSCEIPEAGKWPRRHSQRVSMLIAQICITVQNN